MNQPNDISSILSQIEEILKNMLLLSKQLSLYDKENAVVMAAADKLTVRLKTAHRQGVPVQFTITPKNFMVGDNILHSKNQMFSKYAHRMFQHGITSVTITPELTTSSLYDFLRILMDSPAVTWKQGGIINLLQQRKMTGLILTQMSRDDFLLVTRKQAENKTTRLKGAEKFWERFARALLTSVTTAGSQELTGNLRNPAALARQISAILTGNSEDEQIEFNKTLLRCITTSQTHQPKSEQLEILIKLAELVNHLDDDPGRKIIRELCALQIPAGFAKDLFDQLSNKHILNAFHEVVSGPNYASPMMISLLKTLADSRGIVPEQNPDNINLDSDLALKSRDILSNEKIIEFVPAPYQQALMKVLVNQQPPVKPSTELKKLKKSLEDFHLEAQVSQLSIVILQQGPDTEQLQALQRQIIRSMQFFVESSNYNNLLILCRSCFNTNTDIDAPALAANIPPSLLKQLLVDASALEKDRKYLIGQIIDLIGAPFIRPLLELVVTEKNRSNRFFYLSCLKKLGKDVIREAVSYLNDNQWFVVRNMLLLLGELEAKEELSKIRPLLKHSHGKVRQEALKTCLLLEDSQAVRQLKASLSSVDRKEILNAILLSKLVKNLEISAELITMLKRKAFFAFDLEMKKALVQSLAENTDPAALKVFSNILRGRHLFKPLAYEQLKTEVVRALAKYPLQQVKPLLQQQLIKGGAERASLASQILSRNSQGGIS